MLLLLHEHHHLHLLAGGRRRSHAARSRRLAARLGRRRRRHAAAAPAHKLACCRWQKGATRRVAALQLGGAAGVVVGGGSGGRRSRLAALLSGGGRLREQLLLLLVEALLAALVPTGAPSRPVRLLLASLRLAVAAAAVHGGCGGPRTAASRLVCRTVRLELLLIASSWVSLLLNLLHAIARIEGGHLVVLLLLGWCTSTAIHGGRCGAVIGTTAPRILLLTLTATVR